MSMTGADALLTALEREGCELLFGLPGGAILPTYDRLRDARLRHLLFRHEQGAGHAAEAYAQVTGRPGVCLVTSGPGATNLVTPITDAAMDSIPLVAITGQVALADMGRQAFQEAPITEMVRPVAKQTWLVRDPDEIPQIVHDAFRVALEGRPGPVLIDLPKDVQRAVTTWRDPVDRPRPEAPLPPMAALDRAAALVRTSSRPVLYVGGGAVRSRACAELRALAEEERLPVATTLMARGAFPDSHPLALGMTGMHGAVAAVRAMQEADLLVAVGARFDDRVTGRLDGFAPHARVVQLDIDPRELGKNRPVDVGLAGDARQLLAALRRALERCPTPLDGPSREGWLDELGTVKRDHPWHHEQPVDGPLKPQRVVQELLRATGGRAIVSAGVGQHQMWAAQRWIFDEPNRWVNSGGLGTMGFGLPAALGAKAARPHELVCAIDGDGSFQMTAQELATSVAEDLPVLVVIVNNGYLGMVKQWQELFFSGHSQIDLRGDLPDFVRLAEAYGCVGLRAERPDELADRVEQAVAVARRRTVVLDCRVDPSELVFPMVPAGGTNDDLLLGPQPAALV